MANRGAVVTAAWDAMAPGVAVVVALYALRHLRASGSWWSYLYESGFQDQWNRKPG